MLKKINNVLDKPITWKSSLKVSGVASVLYLAIFGIWYFKEFR